MNPKDVIIKECPYCGHDKFGLGYQRGEGYIVKRFFSIGQPPYHIICLNCGSIVRTYIEDPEAFKGTL